MCSLACEHSKRQAPAPLGGTIAPEPDQVTACPNTRLHNFPGPESFLRARYFFMVPPTTDRGCLHTFQQLSFLVTATANAGDVKCSVSDNAGCAIGRRALFPHASNATPAPLHSPEFDRCGRCDG